MFSARHDACHASEKKWPEIINALKCIAENNDEKQTTRSKTTGLHRKLKHLATAILVIVWNVILSIVLILLVRSFRADSSISPVVQIYDPLVLFLQNMRDKPFSEYEERAKGPSGVQDYYRFFKPEKFS